MDIGAAEVVISNGAKVNLNNNIGVAANGGGSSTFANKEDGNVANTFLRGFKMTVEGAKTVVNIGNPDVSGSTTSWNTKAVFGYEEEYDKSGKLKYSGSHTTINDATINFYGAVVDQTTTGSLGYAARIQAKTLEANNAVFNVKDFGLTSGNHGAGATYNVYQSTLTDSYLTIEDQASLTLELREFNKEKYNETQVAQKAGGDQQVNNVVGRDFNGRLTIDGGVVVIDGVLRNIKGGLLEIKDGTQLTGGTKGSGSDKLDNSIYLGVQNDASSAGGSFANSTLATLRLSATTLDQFLNSTAETITDRDGQKITDQKGQLVLHEGARVEFTDPNQVEISKFTFNNNAGLGHISTTIDGKSITDVAEESVMIGNKELDGELVDGMRTMVAANMSIGKSLLVDADVNGTDAERVSSGNASLAFRFEANDLTVGSEASGTKQGFDSKNELGVYEMRAHKSITFIDGKSDTYYLQDNVVLDTTTDGSESILGTVHDAQTGTIKGDHIVLGYSGDHNIAGEIAVQGGHWSTSRGQSLTINNGKLKIEAQEGTLYNDGVDLDGNHNLPYYLGGVESTLTLNGGSFVIAQNSAEGSTATIEVTGAKGAKALLDLRNTDITWGSGSITVKGDAYRDSKEDYLSDAGEGQLYITSAQFQDFVSENSKTQLTLSRDGVFAVSGTISELDVNTFVTDEAAAGKIYFSGTGSGGGTLYMEGALTLVTKDADGVLALKEGSIDAHNLTLHNQGITAANKGDLDQDVFTISGGHLEVGFGLYSPNSVIEFTKSGDYLGTLTLDTDDNEVAGVVGAHLRFDGGYGYPLENEEDDYVFVVDQGQWAFEEGKDAYFKSGANFKVGTNYANYALQNVRASLSLDNLNVTGTSSSNIGDGATLTVNTMQAGAGTNFDVDGQFTINGRSDIASSGEITEVQKAAATAGIDLKGATFDVDGPKAQLRLGKAATAGLIKVDDTVTISAALSDAEIILNNYGVLYLDFDSGTTITAAHAKELAEKLIDTNNHGKVNVGGAHLDITIDDEENQITSWENVKDFADLGTVTGDQLMGTLINNIDQGTTITGGDFGALETTSTGAAQVDGSLGLHQARGEYFVSTKGSDGQPQAVGVKLATNSALLLDGAGKIGAITGTTGSELTITAGQFSGAVSGTTEILGDVTGLDAVAVGNHTTVAGNVKAKSLALEANTSLSNGEGKSMELGSANTALGSSLATSNLTLTGEDGDDSWLMGQVAVAESLTVKQGNDIVVANGTITANETKLAEDVTLRVGLDADTVADDPNTDVDEASSYTGSFETQSIALNGAKLIVDPTFEKQTAIASVYHFSGVTDDDMVKDKLVGTMDGSVFVGQNSALGVGSQNLNALREVVSRYQVNGSLTGDYGSILYLDGVTTLKQDQGVVMTAQSLTNFVDRVNKAGGSLGTVSSDNPTLANTIFFGQGSALIATADAVNAAQKRGEALITFEDEGKLVADGGELLISGDLRANPSTSYKLFADQTGTVDVVDIKGDKVADGQGIKVATENGFLFGMIDNSNGGTVSLQVDEANARSIMSAASAPVVETLITYARGYHLIEDENGKEVEDPLYNGYYDTGKVDQNTGDAIYEKDTDYSNYFLAGSIQHGNGAAAEAAARLSVYGGAPQAALSAGKSSTDAIASRFGIGASSNLTFASNRQGATLWLAPVYKSVDSDGFEAQGVDYGVDVDLYGVALGADYTLSNGVTFGAMFNVGSGDIDGEGAAAQVSNDFDYYGFGLYAGYSVGQFSVIGDVSYTVADNEIEANTEIDKIGAKMDSSNLSLGVTGKYELSFNGVAITPHAGLRFSSIDLDDYTIDGEEAVASVDSDRLNLFAIPVGLTVAKEFKAENWTVAPSFDLTLTGQFGDDELDGDVAWAGVSNLSTHTTTEVFDNFTYGAALGVEAKSVGGIALGLSVGYTGSSNTDEFGVNANARFSF